MKTKYLPFLISLALLFYFGLFFAQKINLTTADLGRHIINGKVFLTQGKVISTNFYSYTQPDFPTVTHHWFSGVVFYLVEKAAGFTGLSIFYVLISGLTALLFLKTAQERSNFGTALFFTILVIPLLADRKEIRPEGFSYLFMGLYYYILILYKKGKISFRLLLPAILITQLLWVNMHLFFVMGIFMVAVFTAKEFIEKHFYGKKSYYKKLGLLLVLMTLVSLINPYGIHGLLEPFNILKEYGYMIIENQTILFMQKRAPSFKYFYIEALSIVFLITAIQSILVKRWRSYFISGLLTLTFLVLAFRAIRGIPLFALFFIPFMSQYFYTNFKKQSEKLVVFSVVAFILTLIPGHFFSVSQPGFGFGIIPGVNDSAEFVKQNKIGGPIFNNYDIGGYLIYHFNDQEKVFVDNRPESYSVEFFKDLYVPSQENEEKWQETLETYDFNVIYFYRRDATPWAQPFLIERIKDDTWVPVFVDNYVLILVRNNEKNKGIIESHEIPKSVFVVTPS